MEVEKDDFPILGIDHIEMFVGSSKQAANYFSKTFGFHDIAYAGLETGRKTSVSRVLAQGDVLLVFTGSLNPDAQSARSVAQHGDSVKNIALRVPDARKAYKLAVQRGAISIQPPHVASDQYGRIVRATIGTYGDTVHSFIERDKYDGPFLPGYQAVGPKPDSFEGVGLEAIDHVVGNVELGNMDKWANYYARVMGFTNLVHFTDKEISTEYTSLMSKVMQNGTGKIKFPINEPAVGKRQSQIDEYLKFHGGAGVQHIAFETKDILATVSQLQANGVKFLSIPSEYYDEVRVKFADLPEVSVGALAALGILADRDEEGYLLQIFTEPLVDRPTIFFEIIERRGSRGFGLGNFKALFEAIERQQEKRGTL